MPQSISLFLCGDVMTGRGIDQVLPHPSNPVLYESYVKDAREYVRLAETENGHISTPVSFSYIWGDALQEFKEIKPSVRLANLETSVTKSDNYWVGKGIHYRMNPENIDCLVAARIDFCSLANNHVLDWGYSGLEETLETLRRAGIKASGAGGDIEEAELPSVLDVDGGRVLVYASASSTSGVPFDWGALRTRPGVEILEASSIEAVKQRVGDIKRENDIAVFSVHWGPNWGYGIPFSQQDFARRLIDDAGVDVVWGHSSHHFKGIEVYNGKLIIYGCGDFLNDYEGIGGFREFRGDLGLMYFAAIEAVSGKLSSLRVVPTQVKRFRVNRASKVDAEWVESTLNREGGRFGTKMRLDESGYLTLGWT